MKQCSDRAIELFIRKINVYEDKIEIFLNYSPNVNITMAETISKELFTETPLHLLANLKVEQQKPYTVYLII